VKVLDHLPGTVLEHPPAIDRAVEITRQIEHRLCGPVAFDRHAAATAETEDATGETGEPQGFHQHPSRVFRQRQASAAAIVLNKSGNRP
jgi:hypothetical protein